MSEPMSFKERARAVLKDYIRSVVLIDDRWPEIERQRSMPEAIDPSLIDDAPDELEVGDFAVPFPEATEVGRSSGGGGGGDFGNSDAADDHELLHVKTAVMESGIIFAGVRYVAKDESRCDAARKLALRSDVLILDWNLAGNDGGETALKLLDVLQKRASGPRFIYVFTQDSDLGTIANGIRKQLGAAENGDQLDGSIDFSSCGFSFAIRRKNYAGVRGPESKGDVKPAELIDDALNALADAKAGLLDMALVELTTRHRWHLNSMIERIGSRYDAALIAEHAFDGPLDLTQGTIYEILFDEWRAQLAVRPNPPLRILSEEGVNSYLQRVVAASRISVPVPTAEVTSVIANIEKKKRNPEQKTAVRAYKNSIKGALDPLHQRFPHLMIGQDLDDKQAVELGNWPQSIESIKQRTPTKSSLVREAACATIAFCCDEHRQTEPQVAYLQLQSLLTQRRHLPERVTQGTVFRPCNSTGAWDFVVCTTPLCDAHVPKKVGNYFTFLTARRGQIADLRRSALDEGTAIVIEAGDGREPTVLVVQPAPVVALYIADPTLRPESPSVEAHAWPMAQPAAQSLTLTAVAQLRRDHAFHLASRALGYAGRIGLDHVEFLRAQ